MASSPERGRCYLFIIAGQFAAKNDVDAAGHTVEPLDDIHTGKGPALAERLGGGQLHLTHLSAQGVQGDTQLAHPVVGNGMADAKEIGGY